MFNSHIYIHSILYVHLLILVISNVIHIIRMKKGRRAQSAPVRRPPPPHHPPSFATKDKVSNKQHTSLNTTNTSYSIPTLKVPQQQQHKNNFSSSISFSSRSSRSTRDTLLDDFTTKFVKTRNELNARNQQCELLALEIEKYKKV